MHALIIVAYQCPTCLRTFRWCDERTPMHCAECGELMTEPGADGHSKRLVLPLAALSKRLYGTLENAANWDKPGLSEIQQPAEPTTPEGVASVLVELVNNRRLKKNWPIDQLGVLIRNVNERNPGWWRIIVTVCNPKPWGETSTAESRAKAAPGAHGQDWLNDRIKAGQFGRPPTNPPNEPDTGASGWTEGPPKIDLDEFTQVSPKGSVTGRASSLDPKQSPPDVEWPYPSHRTSPGEATQMIGRGLRQPPAASAKIVEEWGNDIPGLQRPAEDDIENDEGA